MTEQEKLSLAKNALKMNLSLEQISMLTELDINIIRQLQNEI